MARVNNLTDFLTDVATAIKTKKGSSTSIPAANFDTEILALPSQGMYQTKSITINSNGTTVVRPDQNYDAIEELTVTVSIPVVSLQTKSYTFNTNQTIELLPDTGYSGFSSVNMTINVPAGATIYSSVSAMNSATGVLEDSLAVVYGTDYVGTYRYDNSSWTEIGGPSSGQQTMDNLNTTMNTSDQYEGYGGTENQILSVMNDILGTS